jgi:SAM-dependent methyltransferase
MSARARDHWDAHYTRLEYAAYPDPDPLLLLYTPPGSADLRALDLAGGFGQNALWLAEQDYTVDLMDVSRVGLLRAQREMAARGLRNVNVFQVDLDEVTLQAETYDLIAVFRYFDARLIPQIRAAMRPHGRVIYETFNRGYLTQRPTFNPNDLLHAGELVGFFGDWRILFHHERSTSSQVVAIKDESLAG